MLHDILGPLLMILKETKSILMVNDWFIKWVLCIPLLSQAAEDTHIIDMWKKIYSNWTGTIKTTGLFTLMVSISE
jgi:hypothetical protein